MDVIDPILSIASEIYSLVEKVMANKKRCRRVVERVKALAELVQSVRQRDKVLASAEVDKALRELSITLKSAKVLIEKYTQSSWVKRVVKSGSHMDDFNTVNDRLNDAFQILSGALQVEQSNMLRKLFDMSSRQRQDEVDGREDDAEIKTGTLSILKHAFCIRSVSLSFVLQRQQQNDS